MNNYMNIPLSHPVWVRGLKHKQWVFYLDLTLVAPRVGAWIETISLTHWDSYVRLSHPVWVRGLKQENKRNGYGLKTVAPRVGAWIETRNIKSSCQIPIVAPRVGAWIET